jgi:hypothetical protein
MPYAFPSIKPSSRSYTPGTYPQSVFESQNGTQTIVRFGNKRVDSKLELSFNNISNAQAAQIIANYEQVNSVWDYVTFSETDAIVGVNNSSLANYMKESGSGLKYRYSEPPSIQSSVPGRSSVTCSFVAVLDGA